MTRLRQRREAAGLSRLEVARRSRIAPTTYGRIERGDERPYDVWKARIAQALGWPVDRADELFEDAGNASD